MQTDTANAHRWTGAHNLKIEVKKATEWKSQFPGLKHTSFRNTRICVVFLSSGVVALIEAPAQLQVVEPHLQKCIDVTCCTQIGQADKSVLEERERGPVN